MAGRVSGKWEFVGAEERPPLGNGDLIEPVSENSSVHLLRSLRLRCNFEDVVRHEPIGTTRSFVTFLPSSCLPVNSAWSSVTVAWPLFAYEVHEVFDEAALDRVGLRDHQCLRLDRFVRHRCFSLWSGGANLPRRVSIFQRHWLRHSERSHAKNNSPYIWRLRNPPNPRENRPLRVAHALCLGPRLQDRKYFAISKKARRFE